MTSYILINQTKFYGKQIEKKKILAYIHRTILSWSTSNIYSKKSLHINQLIIVKNISEFDQDQPAESLHHDIAYKNEAA